MLENGVARLEAAGRSLCVRGLGMPLPAITGKRSFQRTARAGGN